MASTRLSSRSRTICIRMIASMRFLQCMSLFILRFSISLATWSSSSTLSSDIVMNAISSHQVKSTVLYFPSTRLYVSTDDGSFVFIPSNLVETAFFFYDSLSAENTFMKRVFDVHTISLNTAWPFGLNRICTRLYCKNSSKSCFVCLS